MIWGIGFPSVWYVLTSRLFLSVPESVPDARHAAVMAEMKAANAVSLALFGVLMVSLVVFADSLTADVEAKRYRKLRTLPVSPSADFVGRFLAATGFACVAYVVVVAVGALDGAAYTLRGPASIPVVAASLGLLSLVGLSLAVVVTHVVAQGEYVVGATNFLLLVGYFLTGFNGVVPGTVPERTRGLVNLLPNSLATRLQVYHTTDVAATGPFSPPVAPSDPVHVGLLFAWAGVLAAVAVIVMRRGIYARRGGA